MDKELFKTFTDDIASPFTTVKCPRYVYRGQVTSEWTVIASQFMMGSYD